MGGELSMDEINEILANRPKRGRPLQRDKWGRSMERELRKAGPNGMEPKELQDALDLDCQQVAAAAKWLRENSHDGPPVLYVPKEQRWFSASDWATMQPGMRSVFAQRASSLVESLQQLAAQAKEQGWSEGERMIRRTIRNANRVREDVEDLVTELA
jgi:hypothetical protein